MGGSPNGHQIDAYKSLDKQLAPGETINEWDKGSDIFVVSFDSSGRVVELQAYYKTIGPTGAKDIACSPFRNVNS